MFTLQSFTAFFWITGAIILLMIIFEDKLLKAEEKYDAKKAQRKKSNNQFKSTSERKNVKNSPKNPQAVRAEHSGKRIQGRYAA